MGGADFSRFRASEPADLCGVCCYYSYNDVILGIYTNFCAKCGDVILGTQTFARGAEGEWIYRNVLRDLREAILSTQSFRATTTTIVAMAR